MPTYAFACDKCSKTFETTMTMSERSDARVECPHCGSGKVTPQMTAFSAKTSRKS